MSLFAEYMIIYVENANELTKTEMNNYIARLQDTN